ncbi:unnamed protein product [Brassica rapa]|uniref:Cell differentiation protein rcd1 n=2 Tax=Brassica TaxID=3705 RepID=A0A3P5ZID5_BRACM|nr:unnamed protein product [Brassica napus]CAG7880467.1 unnamed protein product [Brassica rapa]VDC79862.1 unnamed protein product [Brassica rapa]
MVNLPDSLYEDYTISRVNLPSALASTVPPSPDIRMIIKWVNDLHNNIPSTFDFALQNLTICITHYPETRNCFLKADMQYYFYPLMDINVTDPRLECLRIGALGVIAHMLRPPVDPAAVCYLVNTSCLQHCTKAIEIGSTESKTIAVFIINKILSTGEGLQYCCVLPDRFFFIDGLLKRLLMYLTTMARPCPSLFNLLVGCYTSLSYKPRARRGLRRYLPDMLFNNTFASLLAADPAAERNRRELIKNLEMKTQPEKNRFTK